MLLVIEHKAWPDPGLHAQALRYVVHVRRVASRRGAPPPLVVATVLQHGGELPQQHDERHDLPPAVRTAFAPLQPRLHVIVDSLHGRSETALRRNGLTAMAQLTHLALAKVPGATNGGVLAAIDRWGDLLREVERADEPSVAEESLGTPELHW